MASSDSPGSKPSKGWATLQKIAKENIHFIAPLALVISLAIVVNLLPWYLSTVVVIGAGVVVYQYF